MRTRAGSTDVWFSHQWVHFIQSHPILTSEKVAELDAHFHFSESGTSEALSAWLEKSPIRFRLKSHDRTSRLGETPRG